MAQTKILHELFPCTEPTGVFAEIRRIISMMDQGFDFGTLEQLHIDIQRLFAGQYPGYQASNTLYHDLKHSYAVALALVRILHGLHLHGQTFSRRHITLAVSCAFFHDTGLIQQQDDHLGTGAKYTVGHEERSISLMREYLGSTLATAEELEDCGQVIRCTILSGDPQQLAFCDPTMGLIGQVLGTADLLAQMSDLHYLEKLPDLFKEFQEGGLPGYASEMEIISKTEEFYHSVALKRLQNELGNIGQHVHLHFLHRWGIDLDLYTEAIDHNMCYLRALKEQCEDKFECYQRLLRQGLADPSR
jgi:hypothetical protein